MIEGGVGTWEGSIDTASIHEFLISVTANLETDKEREGGQEVLAEAMPIIERMKQEIDGMRRQIASKYRPSSEKVSPDQLSLALLEYMVAEGASDLPKETIEVPAHKRKKRKKRTTNLDNLERVIDDKHPPDPERHCNGCNREKDHIGFDKTEHLEFEPAQAFVREERAHKYACRDCKDGIVSGNLTPKLIPGSVVTPSLMAQIMTSKVCDAMPLYRQSTALLRRGIELSDKTLGQWYAQGAELLSVFNPGAKTDLLKSALISFDDTPMPMQNPAHPKNIQRGRFWIYLGDRGRTAYCEFSPDWKGIYPCKLLTDFQGNTQHDGYAGIKKLYRGLAPPRQAGCMDHSRRKFVHALQSGDKRAAPVIDLMARLYQVERYAQDNQMTDEQRLALRQQHSVSMIADIDAYVAKFAQQRKSRTPLAKAVTYWTRQREALGLFLQFGSVPISNAHVERALRIVTLVRKNALFVGSREAGQRYATIMTAVLNCTLVGANPYEYLRDIFHRIAAGISANQLRTATPAQWLAEKIVDQE